MAELDDDDICYIIRAEGGEEEGEVGAEDEVEMAEAGGGGDEEDGGGEDLEQAAHIRLRPIEQLIVGGGENADEAVVGENIEGARAEGEEGEGVVVYKPLPAAAQGPRPRRRPPKEQWVLTRDHPQPQVPIGSRPRFTRGESISIGIRLKFLFQGSAQKNHVMLMAFCFGYNFFIVLQCVNQHPIQV